MPPLEVLIAYWRREMSRSLPHSAEIVTELEDHLRESISTLEKTGYTPEAAFDESVRRLGKQRVLAEDFQHVHRPWSQSPGSVVGVYSIIVTLCVLLYGWGILSVANGKLELWLAVNSSLLNTGHLGILGLGALSIALFIHVRKQESDTASTEKIRLAISRLTWISLAAIVIGYVSDIVLPYPIANYQWSLWPGKWGSSVVAIALILKLVIQRLNVARPRMSLAVTLVGLSAIFAVAYHARFPIGGAVPSGWVGIALLLSFCGHAYHAWTLLRHPGSPKERRSPSALASW